MFAKLLKYEWKASAGLLGILSAAALGSGIVGSILLRTLMGYVQSAAENDDTVSAILAMPLTLTMMFLVLALVVYMVAVQFILLYRFYKNKFTDEGYLTFTLPVSSHQIFLSSLTNMLIWSLISGLVLTASAAAMFFVGFAGIEGFDVEMSSFFDSFNEAMSGLQDDPGYTAYSLLSTVGSVVEWICQPILMMSCITVGAVLAKKHKILTAIGAYYAMTLVVGTITGSFSTIIALDEYYDASVVYGTSSLIVLGLQVLLSAGLGVGGYFLSTHLMSKKLNLP